MSNVWWDGFWTGIACTIAFLVWIMCLANLKDWLVERREARKNAKAVEERK